MSCFSNIYDYDSLDYICSMAHRSYGRGRLMVAKFKPVWTWMACPIASFFTVLVLATLFCDAALPAYNKGDLVAPKGDAITAGAAGREWATTHAPTGWHNARGIVGWLKRQALTGRGGAFTDVRLVTGNVRDSFQPVTAFGPFRGWKTLGGQYFTNRPGDWSLATDSLLAPTAYQRMRFVGDNLVYHSLDVGFWTGAAAIPAAYGYKYYVQQR